MSAIHEIYSNLNVEYEYLNNDSTTTTHFPFTQLDTVITNRLFTPDNYSSGSAVPEDLQIRVSKDIKFFVGSLNDGAESGSYSLKFSETDNTALIDTQRGNLNMQADYLNMNSLTINNNAGVVKVSTDKFLQIHSAHKIQMIGKTEFSNEVKMDQNVYVGKSLIFFNSGNTDSNNQVRIGLQYNTSKDTLDIVKQMGSGANIHKRLMARLGQGGFIGQNANVEDVPYYISPTIPSASFTTDAAVFNANNIWKQNNSILYYGVDTNEKVGVGTSNVSGKFAVVGDTKINDVLFTTDNVVSGIRSLSSSNITTNIIVNAGDATINGKTTVNNIDVNTVNFKNNASVNSFNGNLTTLSNDLAPWLKFAQSNILLSGFSNNAGFISKLQEVVVDTKWRLKEDGEELRIEKYDSVSGSWEEKFKFS